MTALLDRLRSAPRSVPAGFAFDLGRFDVRSLLPAAIQAAMQNGLLDQIFLDALLPEFLFPRMATPRPWNANLGDTVTFTRTGLLTPVVAPITGSDPSVNTYGIEQYSMTMDQYGNAMDTNMLQSAMLLASKFAEDQQKLGINAGQSLNQLCRNKLYAAYRGGRTWCITAASTDTSIIVQSVDGFTHVLVNGVPTPVSATNPLSVTIAGVGNTVTAVNPGTRTLTLGTTRVDVVGDSVIAANAPVSFRPAAKATAFNLAASDLATFSLFRSAVKRLREQNVPQLGGAFVAFIDPATEAQLFSDTEFQNLSRSMIDSPVWQNFALGRFAGIDWVRNNELPILASGTDGLTAEVHQPILLGADALIAGPFERMGQLLAEINSGVGTGDIAMIGPAQSVQVARIIRPPQDRLQQIIGSAWSWVGDFAVPSDSVTGDTARFKRGVVIQHGA